MTAAIDAGVLPVTADHPGSFVQKFGTFPTFYKEVRNLFSLHLEATKASFFSVKFLHLPLSFSILFSFKFTKLCIVHRKSY